MSRHNTTVRSQGRCAFPWRHPGPTTAGGGPPMAAVPTRSGVAALLALLALAYPAAAKCCPFCDEKGPTLLGDYKQAAMVLLGTFSNAKLDPNGNFGEGTTDFTIEVALKRDKI